jgi:hypothetical protein
LLNGLGAAFEGHDAVFHRGAHSVSSLPVRSCDREGPRLRFSRIPIAW